ncbi:G-type lectin S-receptor-like serine/threonine-protein kinase RKS1 isoform X1 [Cannabis sativa]|uniref:G-type lectin S-receptor-like serine/threonine-protein kinase RKS1 isoform X1 n=1 Tax=Cannabis sativa TaxID=3483 RepID=UPI0029C9CB72|nr:G-type lectin S-receptor-like serine/threonine-protein kinase RKS1 isoform X1 [Cannabis sativa]
MNYAKIFLKSVFTVLLLHYCSASDSITVDQPIKDDGTVLVSNGGTFALGFFSPGKSSSRYLGIWFNFSNATIVWVANRDSPINDTTGVLSIDEAQRNLVLNDGQNVLHWSTNISSSSTNKISAQILDSGNLILLQEDNKKVIWQSFDHPTHALLSGLKLGLNLKTGLNRFITSWKSKDDPGTGNCSLRMVPNGSPQLILYKDRTKWWRAGHWNGLQWSGIPALSALPRSSFFNISFVNDQDEITVMWSVLDPSIFTYITVDGSGSILQFAWQQQQHRWVQIYNAPVDTCDNYAKCGPYGKCDLYNTSGFDCGCLPGYDPVLPQDWALRDNAGGCGKKQGALSMCGNGEGFVKLASVKVPDAATAVVEQSLSLNECREKCLRNCSCMAYGLADVRNGGSGCMTWDGPLMDMKQFLEGGQDLFVRVDAIELAKYSKSDALSPKWILSIVGLSVTAAVLLIASVLYCLKQRKRKADVVLGQPSTMLNDISGSLMRFENSPSKTSREKTDVLFFDFSTVAAATDNFSPVNMLGYGGFGSVYKGVLADGQELAVKRLSQFSGQGVEEFKNEVLLIAKLQHRNLVRLLGCCIHKEEKMLMYEYMSNKSLDLVLFDKNKKSLLDWRKRSHVIIGIARGLLYLHHDSRLKIIHRDLKASNVLLDTTMNPKISDFGMARMFGDDQIEANTTKVVGTYGYMSPEYAMEGLYSIKSDVFSFGVLTLEIITGKKNSHFNEVSSLNLVGQIWDLWIEGKVLEIIDESLAEPYPSEQVLRCIQIGLLCVQELAVDRPTMLEVVFMLGHETPLQSPKRPAFIFKNTGSDTSTSKGVSVNDITVTVLEAR